MMIAIRKIEESTETIERNCLSEPTNSSSFVTRNPDAVLGITISEFLENRETCLVAESEIVLRG